MPQDPSTRDRISQSWQKQRPAFCCCFDSGLCSLHVPGSRPLEVPEDTPYFRGVSPETGCVFINFRSPTSGNVQTMSTKNVNKNMTYFYGVVNAFNRMYIFTIKWKRSWTGHPGHDCHYHWLDSCLFISQQCHCSWQNIIFQNTGKLLDHRWIRKGS